ncbi:MAG: hypothetical protein ACTSYM_11695 [Candidatus Baldrarchaeia archaeon]
MIDSILDSIRELLESAKGREVWLCKIIVLSGCWLFVLPKLPEAVIAKVPLTYLFIISIVAPIVDKILERVGIE